MTGSGGPGQSHQKTLILVTLMLTNGFACSRKQASNVLFWCSSITMVLFSILLPIRTTVSKLVPGDKDRVMSWLRCLPLLTVMGCLLASIYRLGMPTIPTIMLTAKMPTTTITLSNYKSCSRIQLTAIKGALLKSG